MNRFLPISKQDMIDRGWDAPDFVYVSGDAYVDHPSFGHAIISRLLEAEGFRVAMLCQPDWKNPKSITEFGKPKLGFLVSSGNMDSMVNHYTSAKRLRKEDSYTPGGIAGKRPNYATKIYSQLIKSVYPETPVIIGGIEASLRRLSHYDYWSDTVMPSLLISSGADILQYGMGEKSMVEIAKLLQAGIPVQEIRHIRGTVCRAQSQEELALWGEVVRLPSFEDAAKDKKKFAKSFQRQYLNTDWYSAKPLAEPYIVENIFAVQNPPSIPLTTPEFDAVYELPYARSYHPSYEEFGGIPAIEEVKFSITSNRGCFGMCSFCALTFHQGRMVQARSHESILKEAQCMVQDPEFKGYIHDVGGPTANFRQPACVKQPITGSCSEKRCLAPTPCENLVVDHSDYLALLQKLRAIKGVKKVFVRSGIRFDYLVYDKDNSFFEELVQYHISGQLKVAPEHVSDAVLSVMGKPPNSVYRQFLAKYEALNKKHHLKQYVVPYLISSHPGSTLSEAITLAEYLRDTGYTPEQVQDFYPTPGTISTAIYHSGVDPRTMEQVYTPRDPHEKAMQRALLQFKNPKNHALVREALIREKRFDLIGTGKKCLAPPAHASTQKNTAKQSGAKTKKAQRQR